MSGPTTVPKFKPGDQVIITGTEGVHLVDYIQGWGEIDEDFIYGIKVNQYFVTKPEKKLELAHPGAAKPVPAPAPVPVPFIPVPAPEPAPAQVPEPVKRKRLF